MADRKRLDVLLVERGMAPSRERARSMIMEGNVYVDGVREDKAGSSFPDNAGIEYRGEKLKYVSRGGLKLEKAVSCFGLSFDGLICMDIGASTGGFTDCMLQNGAVKVYSIDVGYGQLAWSLRNDERVVCMEQYNFRYAEPSDFADRMDFACTDVSFISLKHILDPAASLLKDGAPMVCLIKPQFEAGREQVGKNGIVRDPGVHRQVIENVLGYALDSGFSVLDLDHSPVKGTKGNIEYLVLLRKEEDPVCSVDKEKIASVVSDAHKKLD